MGFYFYFFLRYHDYGAVLGWRGWDFLRGEMIMFSDASAAYARKGKQGWMKYVRSGEIDSAYGDFTVLCIWG